MPISNRNDDEQLLRWLRLRADGVDTASIGGRAGKHPSYIRAATNRVLNADLAESGESPEAIAEAYW